MYSARVSAHVKAPRSVVYRALLDADAIAKRRVPDSMTSQVHELEAREGGSFRVSLTYDVPDRKGKSESHTDTYHGHFAKLVLDEQVVEVFEFETADPALGGMMTMTPRSPTPPTVPTSWWCTRGSRTACLPPTTRWTPGWPWPTWPSSSRRASASPPGPDTRGAARFRGNAFGNCQVCVLPGKRSAFSHAP